MIPRFLLPYDSFVVETRASVPELVQRLQQYIGPPGLYGRPSRYHPYPGTIEGTDFQIPEPTYSTPAIPQFQGTVGETGFRIRPTTNYKSSFVPNVHGRFEPRPDGTRVVVQIRLDSIVRVFLLLFIGFLGIFTLLGFCAFLNRQASPTICEPALLAFAVYLFTSVLFWAEARPARRALEALLT